MRIRPLIATLLTTVVASTAMAASAAAPASAAPDSGKLTVYMSQTERNVLDLGATGITIGDVVSGSGNVSKTKGGATIGSFAYRSETVRVNIPGGIENRLSTIWFSLPGGSLMASTVINVPSGNHRACSVRNVRGSRQPPRCEPARNSSVDSAATGSTGIHIEQFCTPSTL